VDGYRSLLASTGGKVTVVDNSIRNFQGMAITVKDPIGQPTITGNVGISANPKDRVAAGEVAPRQPRENVLKQPGDRDDLRTADETFWATLKQQAKIELPQRTGTQTVQDGPWKLVVEHGQKTTYRLYYLTDDPQATKDVAARFDNHVLRLRGKLEREAAGKGSVEQKK
jgi:hypothetical protein